MIPLNDRYKVVWVQNDSNEIGIILKRRLCLMHASYWYYFGFIDDFILGTINTSIRVERRVIDVRRYGSNEKSMGLIKEKPTFLSSKEATQPIAGIEYT